MKIGKYDITVKNIWSYMQGNWRILLEKYGPAFANLNEHIKEQIAFRELVSNKECIAKGECKCACPIPDLYYADKMCEDECYPEMMNDDDWSKFKLLIADKELTYPFDWKGLLLNYVNTNKKELISVADSTYHVGEVRNSCNHVFNLINPYNSIITITDVLTSCFCTTADYSKSIDINSEGYVDVTIDLTNRKNGEGESLITIYYDIMVEGELKHKKYFLVLKYNNKTNN